MPLPDEVPGAAGVAPLEAHRSRVRVGRLREVNLPPDVFAVVMATGIVSVAAGDHGYRKIHAVLGVLAAAVFVVLGVGLLARFAAGPGDLIRQARKPDVALRMFTAVAAGAVLAMRWAGRVGAFRYALVVTGVGWLVLAALSLADVRGHRRRDLRDHVHGAWLLPSVAASGVAAVAAKSDSATGGWLIGVAVGAWLIALALYVVVTWLIAWRAVSAPFGPDQVPPDSWILMGAVAVAALAGVQIAASADPGWTATAVHDVTLACWALASVWVPVLLYAEVWKVNTQPGALNYQGVWWSAVFPLGMYSAASAACAARYHLHALVTISLTFFWVATTAWIMVAVGYVHRRTVALLRSRNPERRSEAGSPARP